MPIYSVRAVHDPDSESQRHPSPSPHTPTHTRSLKQAACLLHHDSLIRWILGSVKVWGVVARDGKAPVACRVIILISDLLILAVAFHTLLITPMRGGWYKLWCEDWYKTVAFPKRQNNFNSDKILSEGKLNTKHMLTASLRNVQRELF